MRVRASYFGGLRARLGTDGEWLELPEGSFARDAATAACGHLGQGWLASLRLAVNDEFVPGSAMLKSGDEVALLPPVSGGSSGGEALEEPLNRCFLTDEKPDLGALLAGLDDPSCGALALFVGRVRREQDGREVSRLDYEAHPALALKEMLAVAQDARRRWALGPLVLMHRTGALAIGDVAVVVAVTAAHREAAFAACRFLIDEIKVRVPVWKHEFYRDADHAWLGAPQA